MRILRYFFYTIIIFTIILIPIYGAARLILPDYIKKEIIKNLPKGSSLSIGSVTSKVDLGIIFENVNLTSLRNNLPNEFNDDLTARMMIFDSLHYLPNDILAKVDRSSMATSLETRSPFLDHRVIETAWKLDMNLKVKKNKFSTTGKWILREILSKYIPRNLFERPKAGFGIPVAEWLREPLKEWAGDLLNKQNIKKYGYLNEEKVTSLWLDHINYRTDNSSKLWPIIMWQAWLENNPI